MDDPWWNVRVFLPPREVRRLFAVIAQFSTVKARLAQLSADKLTATASPGNVAPLVNPSPPVDH